MTPSTPASTLTDDQIDEAQSECDAFLCDNCDIRIHQFAREIERLVRATPPAIPDRNLEGAGEFVTALMLGQPIWPNAWGQDVAAAAFFLTDNGKRSTALSTPAAVEVSEPTLFTDACAILRSANHHVAALVLEQARANHATPPEAAASVQGERYLWLRDKSGADIRSLLGVDDFTSLDTFIDRKRNEQSRLDMVGDSNRPVATSSARAVTAALATPVVQGEPVAVLAIEKAASAMRPWPEHHITLLPAAKALPAGVYKLAALATRGPIGAVEPEIVAELDRAFEGVRLLIEASYDRMQAARYLKPLRIAVNDILALSRTPGDPS